MINPSIEIPLNETALREYLKVHRVTKGIKISDSAIKHMWHMINLFKLTEKHDIQKTEIAIIFYAMGYITGKLEN